MVSAVIETPIYMLNHKNKVYIAFPCRIQYLRINGSSHEFQFVDSRWRVDCTSITSGAKNVSEFTTQVVSLIIYHYSARVAESPFSNFQRAMGLHILDRSSNIRYQYLEILILQGRYYFTMYVLKTLLNILSFGILAKNRSLL